MLKKNRNQCFACDYNGHNIINCQRIHYKKDKLTLIEKYNYNSDQIRKQCKRREGYKQNTYSSKKDVREKLLKLRGERMSEMYQTEFLQQDYDWLKQNKDKDVFQVMPKLEYKDGEYCFPSENEQSIISEDFDSNSDVSDDSQFESSYQNTPKIRNSFHQSNQSTRQNKLSLQDVSMEFDRLSYMSSSKNQNGIRSPIVKPKKEKQFSTIINQFNKRKTLKTKIPTQYGNQTGGMHHHMARRKSAFSHFNVQSPNQKNNFTIQLQQQTQENENKQNVFKFQSTNLLSPIQQKEQFDQKQLNNLQNGSSSSSSDSESNQNDLFKTETSNKKEQSMNKIELKDTQFQDLNFQSFQNMNEHQSLNKNISLQLDQNLKDQNINNNQQLQNDQVTFNLIQNPQQTQDNIQSFSSKISSFFNFNFEKNKNNPFLFQKKRLSTTMHQASLNLPEREEDKNKKNSKNKNFHSVHDLSIKNNKQKSNETIKQLDDEDDDQLPYKNENAYVIDYNYNSNLDHLDPPSPLFKLDAPSPLFKLDSPAPSMKNSSFFNQKNQNTLKNFISFQNLHMSSDIISEEKSNSSHTKNSRDVMLSRKNQYFDIENSKFNLSSFGQAANLNESIYKQENADEVKQKSMDFEKRLSNISAITNNEDQKLFNNQNIQKTNSINEFENLENDFNLDKTEKQESQLEKQLSLGKQNNIEEKQLKDIETLSQDQIFTQKLNQHQKKSITQYYTNQPKPKNSITFVQENGLQIGNQNQNNNANTYVSYSKEEKFKMLKTQNISMKDIFQKKQEINKSKFAQHNSNTSTSNLNYNDPQQQVLSHTSKYNLNNQQLKQEQQNFINQTSNNAQSMNNLNTSMNQNILPHIPLLSPSFKHHVIKNFPVQMSHSSHSLASPHNNKDKQTGSYTQIQILNQIQQQLHQYQNNLSQQQQLLLLNMNKQPSTAQTIQNNENKTPKSTNQTEFPIINQQDITQKVNQAITNHFYKLDLDILKQFSIYFPNYNYTNVLKSYNNYRSQKINDFQRRAKRKVTKEQKKQASNTPSKFHKKSLMIQGLKKIQSITKGNQEQ